MRARESAWTAAFLTGGFALVGYVGSPYVGHPPWVGTAAFGATGLLVSLWVVYRRAADDDPPSRAG
jgi:hypothetical protein